MTKRKPFVLRLSPIRRLAASVAAALAAFAAQAQLFDAGSRFLVSWDVGAAVYLFLAWALIARADASETRLHARSQDVAAYVIFIVVLVSAFASMAAITFLLEGVKDLPGWSKGLHVALSVVGVLSSWLLIHTLYTFHYARWYYATQDDDDADRRGLDFPGRGNPNYFDFAYYSFVVGMTSQVSDVAVNAHHMRRVTLLHSVLSFIFNIAVLALSVNIIVSVI
jgi:uncharacterized membrane protein